MLPSSSFVPFRANLCADASFLWVQKDEDFGRLQAQTYCIPAEFEHASIYSTESRILYADRYGGYGTGGAGGSGRCGTDGTSQIKGVGITPLVDREADEFHRSGIMTLEKAANEIIFGEIYAKLLPLGALRCKGMFQTGGGFVERLRDGTKIRRRRTCVIRDFVLRPAHFLRNNLFESELLSRQRAPAESSDALRVRAALSILSSAISSTAPDLPSGTQSEQLNAWLCIYADQLALQIAASVALRINHGALSCGNICLDGRFIDYGAASFVPAFQRHARRPSWQDSHNQNQAVKGTLRNLRLHIAKYLLGDGRKLIPEADLARHFDTCYQKHLTIQLVKLCGVAEVDASRCPYNISSALAKVLVKIGTQGVKEPYVYFEDRAQHKNEAGPPPQFGRNDMCAILREVGTCLSTWTPLDISTSLKDSRLRHQLVEALSGLQNWLYSVYPQLSKDDVDKILGHHIDRRNAPLDFLHFRSLQMELRSIEDSENPASVEQFIAKTVERAEETLSVAKQFAIPTAGLQASSYIGLPSHEKV